MPIFFKISITTVCIGMLFMFIAGILQSVFHNNVIANYFGYAGLYMLATVAFVVIIAMIVYVWQE